MGGYVQIYSAESRVRHFREVVRAMVSGLLRSRYIAYRLALKDIKSEYAKSALGIVWDLLDPLVLGTVFYLLWQAKVFNAGDINMPYSVFVVYGILLYQVFCEATLQSVEVMHHSQNLLTQLKLPPEALILSVLYRVGFGSTFRIAVMLIFSLLTGAFSPIGFIKFLACFPAIILAGAAIGIFLAPFNAIYRDVSRFVRIVLVPLRYVSPVLFLIPKTSVLGGLLLINPLATILPNLRLLATTNTSTDLVLTGIHCGALAVIGLVGWFIFHLSIPVLAERA